MFNKHEMPQPEAFKTQEQGPESEVLSDLENEVKMIAEEAANNPGEETEERTTNWFVRARDAWGKFLELPGFTAEKLGKPIVRALGAMIAEGTKHGAKALREFAPVAGETVRQLGKAGSDIGAHALRETLEKAGSGVGRGSGKLIRGFYEGLRNAK
jgi:hypothetical protein